MWIETCGNCSPHDVGPDLAVDTPMQKTRFFEDVVFLPSWCAGYVLTAACNGWLTRMFSVWFVQTKSSKKDTPLFKNEGKFCSSTYLAGEVLLLGYVETDVWSTSLRDSGVTVAGPP